MHGRNRGLRIGALLATTAWLGAASGAWASGPNIRLTPNENHPNSTTQVGGDGFTPYAAVDIYFDTTDEALAIANSSGNFAKIPVSVSASALPGTHYITAVERSNGEGAQKAFTVNTDWAEFHFDHKLTGRNPWENVLTTGNVSSLDEAWTGSTSNWIESSPAVVGGTVYVGSDDGTLDTFNATTGAPGWSFYMGDTQVYSSPAVANGIVYAASSSGVLIAINATTGEAVWNATLGGGAYYQAPVVVNGIVYIGCEDDNLYAFNASTGALLWKSATGGEIHSSSAVSNGVAYIGSGDGNLYAFNATTGALMWKAATGSPIYSSSPAVSNGVVYLDGDDGYLYAFDAGSGVQVWESVIGLNNFDYDTTPAVAGGVVFVGGYGGSNGESPGIYALNANTGAELWYTQIGGYFAASSPIVANGVIYVGSYTYYAGDAVIYALAASTGAMLWSGVTGGSFIDASPAVSNGMVYVGSSDNNLYAYALNGGNDPIYRKTLKAPAISSLHPDYRLKPAN